jgi:hypothetical protein
MRRLMRDLIDAVIMGIIVSAALQEWWERHLIHKFEAEHG